jgi:hypothetical protein
MRYFLRHKVGFQKHSPKKLAKNRQNRQKSSPKKTKIGGEPLWLSGKVGKMRK